MQKFNAFIGVLFLAFALFVLNSCDDSTADDSNEQVALTTAVNDFVGLQVGLNYEIVAQPSNGTLSNLNIPDCIFYTPNSNFTGNDNFSYTESGITYDVSLTVSAAGQVPSSCVLDSTAFRETPINTSVSFDLSSNEFLCSDDVDLSSFALGTGDFWEPDNGTVSLNGTILSYTPNQDFEGQDSFGFLFRHNVYGIYGVEVLVTVTN